MTSRPLKVSRDDIVYLAMSGFGIAFLRLLVVCGAVGVASAQVPLTPKAQRVAEKLFDGSLETGKLNCDASPGKPFFDFSFRFEAGFVLRCQYRQFLGESNELIAVMRVHSGNRAPLFGDVLTIPAMTAAQRQKINVAKFKGELEISGAVGVGEGDYEVELLVADGRYRVYRKHWKIHAERRGLETNATISLQPGQVAPLLLANFTRQSIGANPLNITVLLNAAPINPRSTKLRIWDRAFLLGSVASLMRQVPSVKVRLVAFNTDQQRELFLSDSLDKSEFLKLSDALRSLELAKISYQTLQKPQGSDELLDQMVRAEAGHPDAVVFLGPQMRPYSSNWHHGFGCDSDEPPMFYLKYLAFLGPQYPDSIDSLTRACRGRVLAFHTPGELGTALEKIRETLAKN